MTVVSRLGRYAWRRATLVRASTVKDDRPPVIYLRAFVDDGVPLPIGASPFDSEEQQLVHMLEAAGPVLALRSPHMRVPELGATRITVTDAWQREIVELIGRCRLVVIRVGDTQNLLWEVREAQRLTKPDQLVLYLGKNNREVRWRAFREHARSIFPRALPEHIGDAVFLCFGHDWSPELRGSTKPNSLVSGWKLGWKAGLIPYLAILWIFPVIGWVSLLNGQVGLAGIIVIIMVLVMLTWGMRILRATRKAYARELGLVK